nr:hypothetical protein [uncultured Pseudoxanthomonas sp.]
MLASIVLAMTSSVGIVDAARSATVWIGWPDIGREPVTSAACRRRWP